MENPTKSENELNKNRIIEFLSFWFYKDDTVAANTTQNVQYNTPNNKECIHELMPHYVQMYDLLCNIIIIKLIVDKV